MTSAKALVFGSDVVAFSSSPRPLLTVTEIVTFLISTMHRDLEGIFAAEIPGSEPATDSDPGVGAGSETSAVNHC